MSSLTQKKILSFEEWLEEHTKDVKLPEGFKKPKYPKEFLPMARLAYWLYLHDQGVKV